MAALIPSDNILKFFYRTMDIREGEIKRTLMMQLSIFLLIATLLIIKPTINSMFLTNVGVENLPFAFILVAVFAGILTTFYSRLLNRISLIRIINYTLLISVACILLFTVLLKLNIIDVWILYMFYVWVAIFAVLATSQFWIMANIVFNAREAKRLFSLIGGAAIAGGIFGGYLTSILAPVMGSENLLFIGVVFLMICIPLMRIIWNSNPEMAASVFKRKKRMGRVSEHPLRLIIKSKHLAYLAMITAISVFVARLVDYQFSAISSMRITDEDELTAFFGFWFSNFNIISLLIQLFVTRRVVGIFGVGISLFFLPAGIFIGAMAVMFFPAIWSAVLIKSFDGSLKQSINKSAIELLALPIPNEIKNQAKTFIDVFIDSFATGLSGLLLIALVVALNLPVAVISVVIILLILLWFFYAGKVRGEYLKLFKLKLNLNVDPLADSKEDPDISKESIYGGLSRVLESGSEHQILFVLRQTDVVQHESLFKPIKKLLEHSSDAVIAEAISKLYHYRPEDLSEEIYPFTSHRSLPVRIAAIEYLIEHAAYKRKDVIRRFLSHKDEQIRYATLLALSNETRDNPALKQMFELPGQIRSSIKEIKALPDSDKKHFKQIHILKAIGNASLREFYPYIHEALGSEEPEVARAAIHAAGQTLDEVFIPVLLPLLANKDYTGSATDALAHYGYKIIPYLKKVVTDAKSDLGVTRAVPAIVERIGTQSGVDFLFEILDYDDIVVRGETVRSLTVIKSQSPYLVFGKKQIISHILDEAKLSQSTLSALYVQQERSRMPVADPLDEEIINEARSRLIRILERRLDDNLDRIFNFLGLKYPPDEINIVYKGIKSKKGELRISAIEFLDNLLEINLKRVLIPIIESSIEEAVTRERLNEMRIKVVSQAECFSMLLEGRDIEAKLAVLNLLSVLNDKKYLPIVVKYVNHPNQKISSTASRVSEALKKL